MIKIYFYSSCLFPILTSGCFFEGDIHLTLPPIVYAVEGLETNIYFENIVLTQTIDDYQFSITSPIGTVDSTRWNLIPTANDVGEHILTVKVFNKLTSELVGTKLTIVKVLPVATSSSTDKLNLLIVGDSLTEATLYPNRIATLLDSETIPTTWKMIGTKHPAAALSNVYHEGWSGRTWKWFDTNYNSDTDRSPFIFSVGSTPELETYYINNSAGEPATVATFLLGINDCFNAVPDDQTSIDDCADTAFGYADDLITTLKASSPNIIIGIGLTTTPNIREEAFVANYGTTYTRWGWKRIQHRLVQKELEHFDGMENIFVVPTELNIDTLNGYPVDNGVHPNLFGSNQIGDTFYAWLRFVRAQEAGVSFL